MAAGAQGLNVPAMQQAAHSLLGEQNFQNFCKMNLSNTTQFMRRVDSVELQPVAMAYGGKQDVLCLRLQGSSFLWHQVSPWQRFALLCALQKAVQEQHKSRACLPATMSRFLRFNMSACCSNPPTCVHRASHVVRAAVSTRFGWSLPRQCQWYGAQVRNIVAVLEMVGCGAEPPSIVSALLDLREFPAKPQYALAPETPLILTESGYRDGQLEDLALSAGEHTHVVRKVQAQVRDAEARLALLYTVRDAVSGLQCRHESAPPPQRAPAAVPAHLGVFEGNAPANVKSAEQRTAQSAPMQSKQAAADASATARTGAVDEAMQHQSGELTKSKRMRRAEAPRVRGLPHIPLRKRACEPTFEQRLAAARARGDVIAGETVDAAEV